MMLKATKRSKARNGIRSDEQDIPVKVVDRRWWATNPKAPPTAKRRRRLAQADVRRGARAAGRREGQAGPGVHRPSTGRRRASSRRRGCGCGARSRRTSSGPGAKCSSEMLEVVDNLDRAVDAAGQAPSVEAVVQGIDMVRRQFLAKLEGLGVDPRSRRSGQPFDPQLHEAVTTVPATSPEQDGVVVGRRPSRLPHRRRRPPTRRGRRRRSAESLSQLARVERQFRARFTRLNRIAPLRTTAR